MASNHFAISFSDLEESAIRSVSSHVAELKGSFGNKLILIEAE